MSYPLLFFFLRVPNAAGVILLMTSVFLFWESFSLSSGEVVLLFLPFVFYSKQRTALLFRFFVLFPPSFLVRFCAASLFFSPLSKRNQANCTVPPLDLTFSFLLYSALEHRRQPLSFFSLSPSAKSSDVRAQYLPFFCFQFLWRKKIASARVALLPPFFPP